MCKITKIILLFSILHGIVPSTFADRGVGKKVKNTVSLNIKSNGSFTNNLAFNLKTGLTYKGSLISTSQSSNSSLLYNSFVTYQKGNTIYIVPFKQKILVPEIYQGYTGMKLIIRHNL